VKDEVEEERVGQPAGEVKQDSQGDPIERDLRVEGGIERPVYAIRRQIQQPLAAMEEAEKCVVGHDPENGEDQGERIKREMEERGGDIHRYGRARGRDPSQTDEPSSPFEESLFDREDRRHGRL